MRRFGGKDEDGQDINPVEDAVCCLLELRAFYDNPRSFDHERHGNSGMVGNQNATASSTSDHVARGDKADLEAMFHKACARVELRKWAVWCDIRVAGEHAYSEREVLRRHNARMVTADRKDLCVTSKNTPNGWAKEVDRVVWEELAVRGWIKKR